MYVIDMREFDKMIKISFENSENCYCDENKLHVSM